MAVALFHQVLSFPRAGPLLISSGGWPAHCAIRAITRAPRLALGMSSSAETGYDIRTVMEDVVEGRAQLVDCREPHEWAEGHLVHAVSAPLSVLQQGILPGGIEPDEKVYVHCAAGVRVHAAAPMMRQLGCAAVVPLREGFASLLQLGMPLARSADRP